jgi:hypothetical protein
MFSGSSSTKTGTRLYGQALPSARASPTVVCAGTEKTTVRGVMMSRTTLRSRLRMFLMDCSS